MCAWGGSQDRENAAELKLDTSLPLFYGRSMNLSSDCIPLKSQWIKEKFYMVGIFGTTLAVLSAVLNLIVLYILISRAYFRKSSFFYMIFLAVFDIVIAINFICLLGVRNIMDYLNFEFFAPLWFCYLRPMFTVAHVAATSSSFLLVSATFERYLSTKSFVRFRFTQKTRTLAAIVPLILGIFFKGSVFWEVTVKVNENCTNRARYTDSPSFLALNNYWFRTVWMFYIRHIFTIFLPFVFLSYMNLSVVRAMRKHQEISGIHAAILQMTAGSEVASEAKENVRSATRILLSIVFTYLIVNVLKVVISVWEHVDFDNLITNFQAFYVFSADAITILTVMSGAIRLPIYAWCNKKFRREFSHLFICHFLPNTGLTKADKLNRNFVLKNMNCDGIYEQPKYYQPNCRKFVNDNRKWERYGFCEELLI